jgi:putative hemolysin
MTKIQITAIVLLITAKAFLSTCEVALLSLRRSKVERDAATGDSRAQVLLTVIDDTYRYETALRVGATAIVVLVSMVVSSELAILLMPFSPWSAVTLFSVVVAALFFGEVLPRYLGTINPYWISRRVVHFVTAFEAATRPLLFPFIYTSETLLALVGARDPGEPEVSEEDIKSIVAEGKKSGVVEEGERQIIHRVFRLGDRLAVSIMTPRNHLVSLQALAPFQESLRSAVESRRAWLPVVGETTDEVLGIVAIHDLIALSLEGADGITKDVVHSRLVAPLRVPETTPLLTLLDMLRKERIHFAIIVDEYGGLAGIATLHDLVEAIVGEVGEIDDEAPYIIKRGDGSWLVDAQIDIDELWEQLAIPERSPFDDAEFHSLGGFIMSRLGHVPKESEKFEANGFEFEVVDMDRHRIDKVLVSKTDRAGGCIAG